MGRALQQPQLDGNLLEDRTEGFLSTSFLTRLVTLVGTAVDKDRHEETILRFGIHKDISV